VRPGALLAPGAGPPRDDGVIANQTDQASGGKPGTQRGWAAWERWSRLERPAEGRVLAGVGGCLAEALGISPLAARLALVALTFVGGLGLAVYVAGWLFVPPADGAPAIAQEAWPDHRTRSLVLGAASALVALLVTVDALGSDLLFGSVSPGLVALAGLVAVWRHARPADRAAVQRLAGLVTTSASPATAAHPATAPQRVRLHNGVAAVRLAAGVVLLSVGAARMFGPHHLSGADLRAVLDAAELLAGFALVLAPWWMRLGRELAHERRERLRAQERAEMAEHLHDSVLQTLALIQRSADDPHKVVSLARGQERELRRWLFDRAFPDPSPNYDSTLSEALATVQRDMEHDHEVKVEVVNVGDAALDDDLRALMAATREAVVNAAKWSGADLVSVFCEVEDGHVSVFVLDRGVGFDPEKVATDRKGITESIQARVGRRGGTATVRSSVGSGTEVTLRMPRRAPA
jgi:signal transduction histidine kinase